MKKLFLIIGYLLNIMLILGCGVRGDPLPPETQTELGRGRPNYKRATEDIQLEDPGVIESAPANEDDEDEEKKRSDEEVF